jgi:hypothetical protein
MVGSCEHSNESSGSTKGGEFLNQLSGCQFLRNSAGGVMVRNCYLSNHFTSRASGNNKLPW